MKTGGPNLMTEIFKRNFLKRDLLKNPGRGGRIVRGWENVKDDGVHEKGVA